MNGNNPSNSENVGFLVVRATTARGSIPIEDATVNVRGEGGMVYSRQTDRSGLTSQFALPAPDRAISESPSDEIPYSEWRVDVYFNGYAPLHFERVPVYSGIVSIQNADLVPLSKGDQSTQTNERSYQ